MSTRSSRRIASRRQDAMGDRDKDGAPAEPGQQHASTAPEGLREDAEESPGGRQRRSRPARRRQSEAHRAEGGQHGPSQEELLHSSAGHSDTQAAHALAGLHGDFAAQQIESAQAAEGAHASAEAEARPAWQGERGPPRSPPKPGRPPLPSEVLGPQLDSVHRLPPLPAVPPASVPYPSLEALASIAEGIGTSGGGEAVDTDEGDLASQQGKRRAAPDEAEEGLSETEGEGGSGDSRRAEGRHKRPRLVWTAELHARFMNAVNHLGVKNAVPKTILQLMNVEGMTRENVASHLQKYRLYLKRMAGYPPAARLPLDTLQQVQQAIQQQGHPPLFQQNIGGMPAAGIGFPGYLPVSSGVGPAAPQWRPLAMPMSSEGPLASEGGPAMQPFPWVAPPFPGPGAFQPGMGLYGQVPPAFSPSGLESGAPPGGYGWFWGMMGGPGASGGPAGPPAQGRTAATGQPVAIPASQGTPHAPSLPQASAVDRHSEPKPAQAVPSQGAPMLGSHAHGADPGGPEHTMALLGGRPPDRHGTHGVQGHVSAKPQPTLPPQESTRAGFAGSPAGLAAHALPATTHTSAPPLAQAHAAPVQLRAPVEASTMEPGVPSGDAPRSRPGHWAEHPGGVPGQGGQHAHQIVGQEPIQEAPSDARHEAANRPSAREGK